MSDEITYTLKKPVMYANQGENREGTFITLHAPNYKQMQYVTPIKQAFMSAISEIQDSVSDEDRKKAETDGDASITGNQAIQLLYSWSGDLYKIILHAEQLWKSGAAMMEGEVKMTTPLLEKMDPSDVEGILGEYLANFIAPSLMGGQ